MAIHPGYMGQANVGNIPAFRFESCNIAAKQAWEAPDMVMGAYDHGAYHAGKIDISGSLSGPATESFAATGATGLFAWAVARNYCGQLQTNDINLVYYCDGGGATDQQHRLFPGVFANNINFSCTAGDNAQFSLDVMSRTPPAWSALAPTYNDKTEKIITWDACSVEITNGNSIIVPTDALLSAFEFSINNNCAPYYSLPTTSSFAFDAGNNGYFPTAIVPGLRTISGSLTAYDPQAFDGIDGYYSIPDGNNGAERATIKFTISGNPFEFKVMFHRVEPTLTTGPIMSTIAFTGVGIQDGLNGTYNWQ